MDARATPRSPQSDDCQILTIRRPVEPIIDAGNLPLNSPQNGNDHQVMWITNAAVGT